MSGDGRGFRYALGFTVILGGLLGLAGLYLFRVPEANQDALMLALGLVLGWGGSVVGYEFGSSPAGRKAADAGLRAAEEQPTGRIGDPVHVAPDGPLGAPPTRGTAVSKPPPPQR